MFNQKRTASFCAATIALALTGGVALADTIDFVITLNGAQEVPPIDTPATGSGTATLDTSTNLLSWHIEFSGLLAPETAAHFHGNAPLCANAGVQINLGTGSPKIGSATLTAAQVNALMEGRWYVNVHSTLHPPGEIRGQVMPAPLPNALPPVSDGAIHVELDVVTDKLVAPNWGVHAPGLANVIFVTDQPGKIWAVNLDDSSRTMYLDAEDLTVNMGAFGPGTFDERGLLGLAFHPNYATNGLFYTYTSEPVDGNADYSTMPTGVTAHHQSVIREWTDPNPGDATNQVDETTSRELLRIDQPQFNHNGGGLAFGPDGMLYIALGDGGGANDQGVGHSCMGNGQDASNPLGSLLRIDPQGNNSPNGEYGIPRDNPFVGTAGILDETWAYGLRNPWRFSFDPANGMLWLADVGQNDIEEINTIEKGGNYGWPHMEGTFYFVQNGHLAGYITDMPLLPASGVSGPFIDPVAEYHNSTDGIAVIGGFVYRGDRVPALFGKYVFGDWRHGPGASPGRLFYLGDNDEILELQVLNSEALDIRVHGFGQDRCGEIYVLGNVTGTPFGTTGRVMRIAAKTGDINGDGVVDVSDLLNLLGSWGDCPPPDVHGCTNCPADTNGDGVVDVSDLLLLLGNWG